MGHDDGMPADEGRAVPDEQSAGERALGTLLDASSNMPPHELPGAVIAMAELVGLRDVGLYLVDLRQLVLIPFPDTTRPTLDLDGTDAGRAFREVDVVASDERVDGRHLWFPLLDGTHRIGVLGASGDPSDPLLMARGRQLAELAAELLVAKSAYGDEILTARRREEMSLPAEMRWALTPPLTFIDHDCSIAAYLGPAYQIAGDAFDYAIDERHLHVAIFDAVGHGLEASRIANVSTITYRHARRRRLELPDIHAAVHAAIVESFTNSAYATAQFATLDRARGRLRWVNAGHPPPLLVRADEPTRELDGERVVPLGILGDGTPTVNEVDLEPGDLVAFHTDGIPEARSPEGEAFGTERMHHLLSAAGAAGENPAETVRRLVHAKIDHEGGTAGDDATVVLVGWRRPLGENWPAPDGVENG